MDMIVSGVAALRQFRSKTGQPSKLRGLEGLQSHLLQLYHTLALTLTHDYPIPLVYARWKFSENEE